MVSNKNILLQWSFVKGKLFQGGYPCYKFQGFLDENLIVRLDGNLRRVEFDGILLWFTIFGTTSKVQTSGKNENKLIYPE